METPRLPEEARRLAASDIGTDLKAALARSCGYVGLQERVKVVPGIWEWRSLYWVQVEVNGVPEWWAWQQGADLFIRQEGEPVLVREGGI